MSNALVIAMLLTWALGPFLIAGLWLLWDRYQRRTDREAMLEEVRRIRALPTRAPRVWR